MPPATSPVTVEVVQLLLYVATDAAAVVAVQPLAHHAHPVLPLGPVEGKVLHLGGDAPAALGSPGGLVQGGGGLGEVLAVEERGREESRSERRGGGR